MTEKNPTETAGRHLLLATDLSVRCDRALDRAAQLAGEWHAELTALNVLDPAASPDQALAWAGGASDDQLLQVAREQLRRDMADVKIPVTLHIARNNDPSAAIAQMAAGTAAGIVVTGVASNEMFGRFLLGSTVEQLARSLPQSLLVVRQRACAPYQRILVASDFSVSSRHALQAAAELFPDRELIVYHAHDMPLAGLATESPLSPAAVAMAQDEYAAWLSDCGLPPHVRVRAVIERGPVEVSLTHYVRQHAIELVVLAGQAKSGVMDFLLGSTASKLLAWLPCDILLARDQRARS